MARKPTTTRLDVSGPGDVAIGRLAEQNGRMQDHFDMLAPDIEVAQDSCREHLRWATSRASREILIFGCQCVLC